MSDKYEIIVNELTSNKITYVDIGARWGIPEPWSRIGRFVNVIGFEPDPVECIALKNNVEGNKKIASSYFPVAISDRAEKAILYLTKKPACSSMLKPNFRFLNQFPNPERYRTTKKIEISSDSLDSIVKREGIKGLDFVKIDAHGKELDILEGASESLSSSIFGVEVEICFSPIWENQPLFSDVDSFLRKKGFMLFDINRHRWKRKNIPPNIPGRGQIIFGDALYFRHEFSCFTEISVAKIIKMVLISAILGYYDYGKELTERFLLEGTIDEHLNSKINSFLRFNTPNYIQKGKRKLRKILSIVRGSNDIFSSWADSDFFDSEIFIRDIVKKLDKLKK